MAVNYTTPCPFPPFIFRLEWFDGIRERRPKRRLQRLRQHTMAARYTFNRALETWGLTTQR